jgi:hypothetical protein
LTNDWFSIGRVERSSRMGGKFDPEHFGIQRGDRIKRHLLRRKMSLVAPRDVSL